MNTLQMIGAVGALAVSSMFALQGKEAPQEAAPQFEVQQFESWTKPTAQDCDCDCDCPTLMEIEALLVKVLKTDSKAPSNRHAIIEIEAPQNNAAVERWKDRHSSALRDGGWTIEHSFTSATQPVRYNVWLRGKKIVHRDEYLSMAMLRGYVEGPQLQVQPLQVQPLQPLQQDNCSTGACPTEQNTGLIRRLLRR